VFDNLGWCVRRDEAVCQPWWGVFFVCMCVCEERGTCLTTLVGCVDVDVSVDDERGRCLTTLVCVGGCCPLLSLFFYLLLFIAILLALLLP